MSISVTYILAFNLYFITYILSKGWLAYINVLLQEFSFKTFSIKFVVSFQYKFLLVGGPDIFYITALFQHDIGSSGRYTRHHTFILYTNVPVSCLMVLFYT